MIEHRLRMGDRDVLLLEGPAGWGECSPLPGYPCDPARARDAAEKAARDGWPAPVRSRIPVNGLVSASGSSLEQLRGLPCVKVKVGARPWRDDVARVREVRDLIGPAVGLRVDANGAWDEETALDALDAMAACDLELAEQPVATIDGLARLRRRVTVPIAADECVRSVDDAQRLAAIDAADAVVLKVQPLGGVRAALDVADAAGVPALVTSMYETSIGIAAGVALAAALPELPYACGLATLDMIAGDVVAEPLRPVDGALTVPTRPPTPDPALIARYAVQS
ncbi:MAG: O-succinylbenzoate synthase [Actinobacteria bacterium]|nr:O-succinylbenzoate synthase [Actinomycetota bacterium]